MALTTTVGRRRVRRGRLRATGRFICRHWLFGFNAAMILFSSLPVLAPVLASLGYAGASALIFQIYSITCHQMPSRSFFIFGHQMAFCERNTAIYVAMTAAGLAYVRLRERGLAPLPWYWYLAMIFPMALDGFTQLFGWRESTWYLRVITGTLFGVACVWLTFPYMQESFQEIERTL